MLVQAQQFIWEPVFVAFSHVGLRIKEGFKTVINGMISGVNFLIASINKIPKIHIEPIDPLEVFPVDDLATKLKETDMGSF